MYNIENLKLLLQALLANRTLIEGRLDMSVFLLPASHADVPACNADLYLHDCGTCMCAAGWAAALHVPERPVRHASYYDYSYHHFINDSDGSGAAWEWLFGGCWPDDFDLLLSRIEYAIDHNAYPKVWDTRDTGLSDFDYQWRPPYE